MKDIKHLMLTMLVALVSSISVRAYDFKVGGICYNLTSSNTVEVTHFLSGSPYNQSSSNATTQYTGSVKIPPSITSDGKEYSVTAIGRSAFYNCSSLTSVVIGNSVTTIGDYAFQDCSSLESVEIPNSVTTIGVRAFYGCSSLTSVVIPNSVTTIGNLAFYNCSSLASVVISSSVTTIEAWAFENCKSLTSVEIPNSVKEIGSSAFENCSSLTSVVIPNSVTEIGINAFYGCRITRYVCDNEKYLNLFRSNGYLTEVVIGNSVTTIGSDAFENCKSLTSVVIPNSVTTIGETAFFRCPLLTAVEIPESVTSIGLGAFSWCSSLTSVEIPESVTEIGEFAFGGCASLESFSSKFASEDHRCLIVDGVFISFAPAGLTSYEIPSYVTRLGEGVFSRDIEYPVLRSVKIPNSVTSIGRNAFANCHQLTSVEIPESVTTIEDRVFFNCKGLESFSGKFASEDNRCLIVDGVLKDFARAGLNSYVIPNSVTEIGAYVFSESYLQSVVIPEAVTTINTSAFANCSWLHLITSLNTTPPVLDGSFFLNKERCELRVPKEAVEDYKAADGWKEFKNIASLSDFVTPVSAPEAKTAATGKAYNLQGMEVPEGYRGIIIQGGKKMLKK